MKKTRAPGVHRRRLIGSSSTPFSFSFADLMRDTCRKGCNRIEVTESFYWAFTVTLSTVPKRQNWEMHLPSQSDADFGVTKRHVEALLRLLTRSAQILDYCVSVLGSRLKSYRCVCVCVCCCWSKAIATLALGCFSRQQIAMTSSALTIFLFHIQMRVFVVRVCVYVCVDCTPPCQERSNYCWRWLWLGRWRCLCVTWR